MKKLNLKKMLDLRSLAIAGIFVLAITAISCNKEDDGYIPETAFEQEAELKTGKAVKKGELSIAEIAIAAGFDSLVVALTYVDMYEGTELVELFLNGTDQYTVFAPTNTAFQNLVGDGQIADLPSEVVLQVLLYHVTDGRRAANSVVPKKGYRTIESLLEQKFMVSPTGMIKAFGNDAQIDVAGGNFNISASNGIIHVIDTVILPEL
ncbi:MAG TPA: fasciclin domain-containing protein [Prolixibacteraceae bacterium]|nr:fasciclin domain-containing protein [Prolixibacteraceae bacterium]